MAVTTSTYFVFLVAVFLLYWCVAKERRAALAVLLFANYFFYAKADLQYLALIPAASLVDYLIGRGLAYFTDPAARKGLLGASLALNLGILASFKYLPVAMTDWHWSLPLGLSFYCFQALTYTIDLYRRDTKPVKNLLSYMTAVSFFPTTFAGPITRVGALAPQLEKYRALSNTEGGQALFRIAHGLVKKLLIADFLSQNLVQRVFDHPNLYTGTETLIAVYAYAFQLYFDFSGYTDIVLGSALLLGIKLPENFNRPYAATNLADFWRRWHISLSSWLRDYLYFAFPGKRTTWMPYVALVLTMVIGGVWHGPSWGFALWGLLHGVGLAFVRFWQAQPFSKKLTGRVYDLLGTVATFHFVCFAWIFFNAASFDKALEILARIGSLSHSLANISTPIALILTLGVVGHYLPARWWQFSLERFAAAPFYAQAAALFGLMLGLQYINATGAAPFIYTKF
jgi:alginate O-acetyltransferase complex protein AlgI